MSIGDLKLISKQVEETTKMKKTDYVTKVMDGDSFETKLERMRLEDVYAPEINEENVQKAKRKLEELILRKNIEYEGQTRDVYARLIVQIWVDGVSVNDKMKHYITNL